MSVSDRATATLLRRTPTTRITEPRIIRITVRTVRITRTLTGTLCIGRMWTGAEVWAGRIVDTETASAIIETAIAVNVGS